MSDNERLARCSMTFEEARQIGAFPIDPMMPNGLFLHEWLLRAGLTHGDMFREDGQATEALVKASWEVAVFEMPCLPIDMPF